MTGELGTHGIIRCLLEAGGEGKAGPVNQVTQVTVVGTGVKNGIPGLRSRVTLHAMKVCMCDCVWMYRIARKFGRELNLAFWWYAFQPPH